MPAILLPLVAIGAVASIIFSHLLGAAAAALTQCRDFPSVRAVADDDSTPTLSLTTWRARFLLSFVPVGYVVTAIALLMVANHTRPRSGAVVSNGAAVAFVVVICVPMAVLLQRCLSVGLVVDDVGLTITNPLRTAMVPWSAVTSLSWEMIAVSRGLWVQGLRVSRDAGLSKIPCAALALRCRDRSLLLDALSRWAAQKDIPFNADDTPPGRRTRSRS